MMTSDLEARLEALRPTPVAPEAVEERVRAAALATTNSGSRAAVGRSRLLRQRDIAWLAARPRLALLLACLAAALAAAAVVVRDSDSSEGLSRISTTGEPIEWQPAYQQPRIPRLLAVRAERAFYTVPGNEGLLCFGVGALEDGRLRPGSLTCPVQRGIFPSPDQPILFHAGREASREATGVALLDIEGFAADGVDRIELRLPNRTMAAAVAHNTFAIDVQEQEFTAGTLVALDTDGQVVYRYGLGDRAASNLG